MCRCLSSVPDRGDHHEARNPAEPAEIERDDAASVGDGNCCDLQVKPADALSRPEQLGVESSIDARGFEIEGQCWDVPKQFLRHQMHPLAMRRGPAQFCTRQQFRYRDAGDGNCFGLR